MIKRIIFPFEQNKELIEEKVRVVEKMVGKKNVDRTELSGAVVPSIAVRCTKYQWKDIKFKLDLDKVYW